MRILIFGNGYVSQEIRKYLTNHSVIISPSSIRCDNRVAVESFIEENKPIDRIICAIGRTHGAIINTVDYLEQKGKLKENVCDNLYAPVLLAIVCDKMNIHLTYIGTGCIFHYDENHTIGGTGFLEEDNGNFYGSSYSTVKNYTDRLMKEFKNVLNVRLRMPITADWNTRNFLTKIISYKNICSIVNSICILPIMLPYLVKMIEDKDIGKIHLTHPKPIDHNEILEIYKKIIDPSHIWKNITIEEQNSFLASERSNNYLDCSKLLTKFPDVPNSKDAILYCFNEMKKNRIIPEFGIIIISYQINDNTFIVLKKGIEHIIELYPNVPIIVIDDYSPIPIKNRLESYSNVKVALSDKKGLAEIAPYIYMNNYKPFKKVLILHDKYHILKPIDLLYSEQPIRFVKYANNHIRDWSNIEESPTEYNIINNIRTHDDKIIDFVKNTYDVNHPFYEYFMNIYSNKQEWTVCLGIMSFITLEFIEELQEKTNLMNIIEKLNDRRDRMVLESLFTIQCLYTGKIDLTTIYNTAIYGEWGLNMQWKKDENDISYVSDNTCNCYHFGR